MKISIIIPTIGRATLKKVLQKFAENENFKKILPEILVIFDGNFSEKILKLKKKFDKKNFYFFETKKKVFAGGARNLGIEKSRGEILVFVDDDCVPAKNFLKKTCEFHEKFSAENCAAIGKILLPENLAAEKFTKFWHEKFQFSFPKNPDFRNFYTANLSLKKKFLAAEKFSDQFKNWGFEDTELGFRLQKKGLRLKFAPEIAVAHEHEFSLENVKKNLAAARANAKIFEKMHEIKILPRGKKLFFLRILIFAARFFPRKFFPKIFWWREIKKIWCGENLKK